MSALNANSLSLNRQADLQQRATDLFKRSLGEGQLRRLWRRLSRRPVALASLGAVTAHGGRSVGGLVVEIAAIVGSEGRAADFDGAFAPLGEHSRDRWVSVASARLAGRGLPPVQLIRAAGGYYVRDGHHRISVARALGEEFIEAEVVSWE